MSSIDTNDGNLKWEVFTRKRPGLSRDLPPGKEQLMWVSNSSTLIYGERDAVLVDTFLTIEQSQALLNWVISSGKNLTAIYLTHGHGDHVFGVGSLLDRFPNARAVATPKVVEAMREQVSPTSLEDFWRKLFPGQRHACMFPQSDCSWVEMPSSTEFILTSPRPTQRADASG